VRGGWCPVAAERFAISADVHLILGHLAPAAYTCPTPDGRPATVASARERVARVVCADAEQLGPAEIDAIAAHVHAEQVRRSRRRRGRSARGSRRAAPVVPLGVGAFLARAVARAPGPRRGGDAVERGRARHGAAAALAELAAARRAARGDGGADLPC
jgi:uncharacterized hydantoinase/oxoprolinase family protein